MLTVHGMFHSMLVQDEQTGFIREAISSRNETHDFKIQT